MTNQGEGTRPVHVITEPCEIITVVEAGDSAGIYSVASKIASIPGVIRCVVCSERELDVKTAGLARMTITAAGVRESHRSRKLSNG